jgi:hypothetical protein
MRARTARRIRRNFRFFLWVFLETVAWMLIISALATVSVFLATDAYLQLRGWRP